MKNLNLKYPKAEPFNFGGLEVQDFKTAKIAILPVPYSSTTYWNPDTKDGPRAIIEASRHIELYDLELKCDISKKVGIFTLPSLSPSKNSPQEMTQEVENTINQILKLKKIPVIFGGEHSITLGEIKAAAKIYKNLSVLDLDAHTDMRDEFEGTKFHHGTVMRRISELGVKLTQVGIRSVSEEEIKFLSKNHISNIFYAPEVPIDKILETLDENVYISIDLDNFDPSIMPSTGTPEPAGLTWAQVTSLIKEVAKNKNIVGFDIVEMSPIPGISYAEFMAAKLAYKIIGYIVLL